MVPWAGESCLGARAKNNSSTNLDKCLLDGSVLQDLGGMDRFLPCHSSALDSVSFLLCRASGQANGSDGLMALGHCGPE